MKSATEQLAEIKKVVCNKPTGERRLVVLDKGFIFIGKLSKPDDDGWYSLSSVYNVRKWSENGFGGLTIGGTFSGATLDASTDIKFHQSVLKFLVPISVDWENE